MPSTDTNYIKSLAFRRIIINLLKKAKDDIFIDEFDPKCKINSNKAYFWDAFCYDSIDLYALGLSKTIHSEKIYFEIKYNLFNDSVYKSIIKDYETENAHFVFITSKKIKRTKTYEYSNFGENVTIIDYDDLVKTKEAYAFLKHTFEKYLLDEQSKEDYFRELLNLNGNFVFALGAGCSIDSNISDWKKLSEALGFDLLYTIIDDNTSSYNNFKISQKLNDEMFEKYDKNSALDAIYNSYVASPVRTLYDYYFKIKNVLYMSYDALNDPNKPLVTSIADCVKRHKMDEVLSYNFDSVLEQGFDNSYKSKSLEIKNSETIYKWCKVKHVHGYIPYDYNGKVLINHFVFTDKDYYYLMTNKTCWSNVAQEDILNNKNVVFVGFSFTDSNVKELLRVRNTIKHTNDIYGFLKLPNFPNLSGVEKKIAEEKYKLVNQTYFDSLGVKIIWAREYEDIPDMINKL